MNLFVYGLLKSGFEHEVGTLLREHSSLIGPGSFKGVLVNLGNYPGAIYDPGSEFEVHGEIYQVNRKKKLIIKELDRFEGVGPNFPEPQEYLRTTIPVHTGSGIMKCEAYLFNRDWKPYPIIKSGIYEN